jgi:hypothetical protein
MVESLTQLHGLWDNIPLAIKQIGTISPGLQSVMWDVTSVSYILQRHLARFDPLDFQEMLISVLYRLINLSPLSNSGLESETEDLYCLALLAFSSTILFNLGRRKKLPYGLLAGKLRVALMRTSGMASLDNGALLWTLFIGGISVFRGDEETWLMPWIRTTACLLGITDWQGAKQHLCQYPWIDAFHDEPARRLWVEITFA